MTNPLKKLAKRGLLLAGAGTGPDTSDEQRAAIPDPSGAAAAAADDPALASKWPYVIRDLVDVEYVQFQVGETFESRTSALTRVMKSRVYHAVSFHPLIEPTWMMGATPRFVHDWMNALRDGGVTELGPYFSLARAGQLEGDKPLDVLRRFLRGATDDTVLPTVDESLVITWGEARALLHDQAERFSVQNTRTHRRAFDEWDAEAEARFRAELALAPQESDPEHPAVTIVMPVYNRQGVVGEAIQSVVDQTWSSWELVVVDDGSTDATRDVVAEFAARDPRIRLIAGARAGVSATRNVGIRAGRGRIVAFIDSDNSWRPDFLHLSVSTMAQFDVPITYAGIKRYETDGAVKYVGQQAGRDYLLDGMSFVDLNVLVVRRELLDRVGLFDEDLRRWVDFDLVLRLFLDHEAKFVPVVGVDYDHEDTGVARITTSESSTWREVVLSKYLVEWNPETERVADRVSVLVQSRNGWRSTVAAVRGVLDEADAAELDVEVVVVDNASSRDFSGIVAAVFAHEPRVVLRREANDRGAALALDIAFAASTGALVLVLSATVVGTAGWLAALVAGLDDDMAGVSAVVLGADGAVGETGHVFAGPAVLPRSLLRGYPVEDFRRAGRMRFASVSSRALLLRSADFAGQRGFRSHFGGSLYDVDLCLRIGAGEQVFAVAPDSLVYDSELEDDRLSGQDAEAGNAFAEAWSGRLPLDDPSDDLARAGLRQTGWSIDNQVGLVPGRRIDMGFSALRAGIPALERSDRTHLRWALKTAAPSAPRGDSWGDTFFSDDLRLALEAEGQEVVVDRVAAHFRRTRDIDDVVVTIRGLAWVPPQPGAINVLWIISHPDLVSDAELRSYDIVYAAGAEWARRASLRTGLDIRTLLQATNPERFHPGLAEPGSGHPVLFVGTPRKAMRPIVADAIALGHSPAIYGHGWEGYVDPALVHEEGVGSGEVGALYRSAGVVLNDHWSDMAEWGFLSNRLFDAAAAGARLISDPVPGLDEVFGGVVATYESPESLRALLDEPAAFANEESLLELSTRIRRDHSFTARAATLIADVEALAAARRA